MEERAFRADAREAKGLHDGAITCLARVVDPQPDTSSFPDPSRPLEFRRCPCLGLTHEPSEWGVYFKGAPSAAVPIYGYTSPFGVPGDRLHSVCEPGEPCEHRGCLSHVTHVCEGCGRGHAGIFLDVTDVRVVRVQDVTEEDAKAYGMVWFPRPYGYGIPGRPETMSASARESFRALMRADGHDANSWLWLATVAKVEAQRPWKAGERGSDRCRDRDPEDPPRRVGMQ